MRGGKRKGAGPPKKPKDKKMIRVSIGLMPDVLKMLDSMPLSRPKLIDIACREFYKDKF